MAIEFDAVTTSQGDTNQLTFSHTVSGNNRLLVVTVGVDDDSGAGIVTGITYNGVALTQVTRVASGWDEAQIWYLINPPTGANNVVVSFDASYDVAAAALSYTGVDQDNPLDASGQAFGDSGTASVNITTVATDALIVESVSSEDDGAAMSPSSGQTERYDYAPHSFLRFGGGDEVEAAAGAKTRQWSVGNTDWAIVAAAFKPVQIATPEINVSDSPTVEEHKNIALGHNVHAGRITGVRITTP